MKTEWKLKSSDGVTPIACVNWIPEGETLRGIVQIIHGIGEHKGRYEEFAKELTKRNFGVVVSDCIGHGESISVAKKPMYFGEKGSWKYLVKDAIEVNKKIIGKYPNIPCFILGFSMGSFVLRTLLTSKDLPGTRIDGCILVGTGSISKIEAKLVNILIDKYAKKYGADEINQNVNDLAFGNYNKFFKPCETDFDWLCESTKGLQEYIEDSQSNKFITTGMFGELIRGMEYTSQKKNIKKIPNIPVLFVSGENDPVGGFTKKVNKIVKIFKKHVKDVTVKIIPEARHDVLHDNHKEQTMDEIISWMVWELTIKKK